MQSIVDYLSKDKYEISVVTSADSKLSNTHFVDPNKGLRLRNTRGKYKLLNKINALFNKLFLLLFFDEYQSWSKRASKKLEEIHREKPIDLLMCSFSPLSVLIAGDNFIKNKKGVKWVLDMRDELSTSPFISERRRARLEMFEKRLLKRADALISVSAPIVELFEKIAKNQDKKPIFSEIRNGFNFPMDTKPLELKTDVFTVSYLGSFYASRKPKNFFRALTELIEEGKVDREKIKICFWSSARSYSVPIALKDVVHAMDGISEQESVARMQHSDALLLVHPSNSAKGVFTGKLFEYIGSCRPVLGLVDPEDVAAELIRKCKSGWVAANESIEDIKVILLQSYEAWLNKVTYAPNIDEIKLLHRQIQIQKLEEDVLNELLEK